MAQRTPAEIYRALRRAGFGRASAVIMTAVGLGESGGNDTALGDTGIQTSTWGPSVGVFQVRTLKGKTGTGDDRDINNLMGNLDEQAEAAYAISDKGTSFGPWTVFTSGKYTKYLGQAKEAAATVGDDFTATPVQGDGLIPDWLVPDQLTPDLPSAGSVKGEIGEAIGSLIKPFRNIGIELAFAGLGAALLLVGLGRAFNVQDRAKAGTAKVVKLATGGAL